MAEDFVLRLSQVEDPRSFLHLMQRYPATGTETSNLSNQHK